MSICLLQFVSEVMLYFRDEAVVMSNDTSSATALEAGKHLLLAAI